jgi:hypothetical protein
MDPVVRGTRVLVYHSNSGRFPGRSSGTVTPRMLHPLSGLFGGMTNAMSVFNASFSPYTILHQESMLDIRRGIPDWPLSKFPLSFGVGVLRNLRPR